MTASVVTVRITTSEGLEYSTTMDSTEAGQPTVGEQSDALYKLALEIKARAQAQGLDVNLENLAVHKIDVYEQDPQDFTKIGYVSANPSMWGGVARLFAQPVTVVDQAPASIAPDTESSPNLPPEKIGGYIHLGLNEAGYDDYAHESDPSMPPLFRDPADGHWYRMDNGGLISVGVPQSEPPAPIGDVAVKDRGKEFKLTYLRTDPSETPGEFFQYFQVAKVQYRRRFDAEGADGSWEKLKTGHDGMQHSDWIKVNPHPPSTPSLKKARRI